MPENEKKRITVAVPVYNEIAMLDEVCRRTGEVLAAMKDYDYEIVFFDDGSTDGSREKIEQLARADDHVKAVFYTRNFGYSKSIFYCMQQSKGDCAILLHADLQNPPELIPEFVRRWENGAKAVIGVKHKSRENKFMFFMRSVFYLLMNFIFAMRLVPHATDFELLDKSVTEILRASKFKNPFLRSIVAEYASPIEYVSYVQDRRGAGKSRFTLSKYYDFAVCGITSSSKKLPRRMLCVGLVCMLIGALEFFIHYLPLLIRRGFVHAGTGLFARGGFLLAALLLCFAAILGEYLIALSASADDKPLIAEEKRIGY